METYLTLFNIPNSSVQLAGQSLKRVLTVAVTPGMYPNIWRKHRKIPDTDGDLLHAVWEEGIEEDELARVLAVKMQIARPQKEKGKEAAPKGKPEQMATTAKEKQGPAVSTGGTVPNKNDKFPVQEILWKSFKPAMKDIQVEVVCEYRQNDADCRRCGRDRYKRRACFASTTSKGTKLPSPPKMPTKRASVLERRGHRTMSQGKRKTSLWQLRPDQRRL